VDKTPVKFVCVAAGYGGSLHPSGAWFSGIEAVLTNTIVGNPAHRATAREVTEICKVANPPTTGRSARSTAGRSAPRLRRSGERRRGPHAGRASRPSGHCRPGAFRLSAFRVCQPEAEVRRGGLKSSARSGEDGRPRPPAGPQFSRWAASCLLPSSPCNPKTRITALAMRDVDIHVGLPPLPHHKSRGRYARRARQPDVFSARERCCSSGRWRGHRGAALHIPEWFRRSLEAPPLRPSPK
jgi:hypothetical protein